MEQPIRIPEVEVERSPEYMLFTCCGRMEVVQSSLNKQHMETLRAVLLHFPLCSFGMLKQDTTEVQRIFLYYRTSDQYGQPWIQHVSFQHQFLDDVCHLVATTQEPNGIYNRRCLMHIRNSHQ